MYKMKPGCIVEMKNQRWVLVTKISKRISGVVEEKSFYLLPPKENFAENYIPYTKKRAENLDSLDKNILNKTERTSYENLKKARWKIFLN